MCVACGRVTQLMEEARPKLDVIAWLFPGDYGPRPTTEAVLVRRGSKIAFEKPHEIRGKPDSWMWSDV